MPKAARSAPQAQASANVAGRTQNQGSLQGGSLSGGMPERRRASIRAIEVDHSDPRTWRASNVPEGKKVNRTDVSKLYRLKTEDIEHLNYDAESKTVYVKGGIRISTSYLYSEREVERIAWVKHGGPEGFEAYLDQLEERFHNRKVKENSDKSKKKRTKKFPRPFRYKPVEGQAALAQPSVPQIQVPQSVEDVLWLGTAGLEQVKAVFPGWLWERCNEALDGTIDPTLPDFCSLYGVRHNRERALRAFAQELMPTYPARPIGRLGSSRSVDNLRRILQEAPRVPRDGDMVTRIPGIERDGPDNDAVVKYSWKPEYLEKVFRALIEVIEEHGDCDGGWKDARWEVYDTYSKCVEGLTVREIDRADCWEDQANDWLLGRLLVDKDYRLRGNRERCDSGMEFNAISPMVDQPILGQ